MFIERFLLVRASRFLGRVRAQFLSWENIGSTRVYSVYLNSQIHGMISVADLLQAIVSDHKALAGMFEAFVFSPR
jgi:hypothetical protein